MSQQQSQISMQHSTFCQPRATANQCQHEEGRAHLHKYSQLYYTINVDHCIALTLIGIQSVDSALIFTSHPWMVIGLVGHSPKIPTGQPNYLVQISYMLGDKIFMGVLSFSFLFFLICP